MTTTQAPTKPAARLKTRYRSEIRSNLQSSLDIARRRTRLQAH
jgi:hypothetical protein